MLATRLHHHSTCGVLCEEHLRTQASTLPKRVLQLGRPDTQKLQRRAIGAVGSMNARSPRYRLVQGGYFNQCWQVAAMYAVVKECPNTAYIRNYNGARLVLPVV